jgi:uroporphyrinogen decarboxylase
MPYHFDLTYYIRRKLARFYGRDDVDYGIIGNHLRAIRPRPMPVDQPEDPTFVRDEYGVVWRHGIHRNIGNWGGLAESPLDEADSLDGYEFPDATLAERYDSMATHVEQNADYFLHGPGGSLFERGWALRGIERFFMDLAEGNAFINELLDGLAGTHIATMERCAGLGLDAFYFNDDFGMQQGLLVHPDAWRKHFKPRLREMYATAHKYADFVMIHTCGDVSAILPDLVELGVNVLHPVQPEAMDVDWIKREFGKDLCLYGGVGTQSTLPYGTEQDVRDEARRRIETLGAGGGYILGPAGAISTDTPIENVVALVEAAKDQASLFA